MNQVPGHGDRFADEFERGVELLLENGVSRNLLYVIALAHGSRKPGYWQQRVQREPATRSRNRP